MDVMEKLIELLEPHMSGLACEYESGSCELTSCRSCNAKNIADRLIANGITVQEWVDVKDRLPEESGMYIVTANDGHAQRVSFVQWQKKNRMWNLTGARSYWRVTHWMPLPEPPKGE